MIFAACARSTTWRQRLGILVLVPLCFSTNLAPAGQPVDVEIRRAQLDNDELYRTIHCRLTTAQVTLQKLTELKTQGHATWLEMSQAQVIVAAIQAEYQSAFEFNSFLIVLSRQLGETSHNLHANSLSESDWLVSLPAIEFRIAAARAQAHAELDAARLTHERCQLHAAAIEHLLAVHAASNDELVAAQNAERDSHRLVTRLSLRHDTDVAFYMQLLESSSECATSPHLEAFVNRDLQPGEIPSDRNRDNFLRTLIDIHDQRRQTSARRQAIAAHLHFAGELIHRLEAVELPTTNDAEVRRARLDKKILQAQQLAAEERLTVLRLATIHLVATAMAQPNHDPSAVIRIDSPTSALPLADSGLKTNLTGGQTSPLTAAAWQPIAPNWPINNWSAARQLAAPSLPLSGNANVRYSEPHYADFYTNGNRRLDAPSISNNFFRSGGLPWYLPGSTTNFK